MSSFPLWLFEDESGKRKRPVLGLKLSHQQQEMQGRKINNALNLFEALFSTMKNAHDEKYISRKHEKNIIFIPTAGHSATEFDLDEETKNDLMATGRSRATQFLKTW